MTIKNELSKIRHLSNEILYPDEKVVKAIPYSKEMAKKILREVRKIEKMVGD